MSTASNSDGVSAAPGVVSVSPSPVATGATSADRSVGADYTQDPLGRLYHAALTNDVLMRELARASNYNNYANNVSEDGVQMKGDDVHHEFIRYLKTYKVQNLSDIMDMRNDLMDNYQNGVKTLELLLTNGKRVFYVDETLRLKVTNNMRDAIDNSEVFLTTEKSADGTSSNMEYGRKCTTELNFVLLYKRLEDMLMKRTECDEDCEPLKVEGVDCPTGLEYLFVDHAYEHVWFWDDVKKCYYKLENGARVEYKDLQSTLNNCYGTYLKGNNDQCKTIAACLLENDNKSLLACLMALSRDGGFVNLFNVSVGEISQTPPHVVRRIMRRLGVRKYSVTDDNGNKYFLPESYENWQKNGGASYASLIENYSNFGNYVKGLISVVENNPVYINEKSPVLKEKKLGPSYSSRYGESVGLTRFELPQVRTKSKVESMITREELGSLAHHFQTRGVPNINYMAQNVVVATERNPLMSFGGSANTTLKDGSGKFFETIFESLRKGLRSMGVELNKGDTDKIDKAIERIHTYESQLAELYKRLAVALQLGEAFGANAMIDNNSAPSTLTSNDFKSAEDVRKFMETHIKSRRKSYQDLYSNTNLLSSHLLNVFGKIAVKCCDDEKPGDKPPSDAPEINYVALTETEC